MPQNGLTGWVKFKNILRYYGWYEFDTNLSDLKCISYGIIIVNTKGVGKRTRENYINLVKSNIFV